jgi:predicted Rossmann fold nucleotide-binding protein DprA/Smf involved in DNA uptake
LGVKVGVVGSRNFDDYERMSQVLSDYDITTIVSGGAKGADSLAERYAKEKGIKLIVFKAEWDKYGRQAGFIRNRDIVSGSDMIIAFWDGQSRGTQHTISVATKRGKEAVVVDF